MKLCITEALRFRVQCCFDLEAHVVDENRALVSPSIQGLVFPEVSLCL